MNKILIITILLLFIKFIYCEFTGGSSSISIIKETYYLAEWDIIGPFPSAPREDVDVLEAYGGINGIPRGGNLVYPSELTNNGMAGWSKYEVTQEEPMVNLNFSSIVNWDLIEAWAGASGLYFSGWGLSDFNLNQTETIVITCNGIAKYFIDDQVMQGDSYQLGMSFNSITLSSGIHTLRIRIIGEESSSFQCQINLIDKPKQHAIFIVLENTIVPDIVEYEFASPFISISFLNLLPVPITNLIIESQTNNWTNTEVTISQPYFGQYIGVGQLMPITFMIESRNSSGWVDCSPGTTLSTTLLISTEYSSDEPSSITLNFTCKSFGQPFTFTFQDFDESIQYAVAIPPNGNEKCDFSLLGCPVLLALHGAGVDAKTNAWTGAYQSQNYSWILLPTNRNNYGFDWEECGIKNAFYALDYLCNQLPGVSQFDKSHYSCDQNQLIISGHSMGGHGSWHVATAVSPDKIVSLSVAAGWIDMKLYSPNFLRVGYSWSHPRIRYILDSVVSENDADLHSPHIINIPTIIRYATGDTNVPPFHLRRMVRLLNQLNHNTSFGLISPVVSNDHWFPGIVDDAIMQAFLTKYTLSGIPKLPNKFLINCLNPGTFQGKAGISILLSLQNFKISKIKVDKSTSTWSLSTENIQRFGFNTFQEYPTSILIDGQTPLQYVKIPSHYCRLSGSSSSSNKWSICTNNDWQLTQRSALNTGPMIKIINYPLLIVYGTIGNEQQTSQRESLGVYLSNVLNYQVRYGIQVIPDTDFTIDQFSKYNVIFMGGPTTNKIVYSIKSILPITITGNTGGKNIAFNLNGNTFSTPSTGALFLSSCYSNTSIPNGSQRVGCMITVIEGTDSKGFENAVFAFPTKSSAPMPDYMITGPNFGYQGVSGAFALGFWDNNWQYQDSLSYVTSILND